MDRSAAAKKAWATRRRRAVPTPVMRKILEYLRDDGKYVRVHRFGQYQSIFVSLSGYYGTQPRVRFTVATFRAMKQRGWVAMTERYNTGGIMGTLPDGTQGVVHPSWDEKWTVTPKGLNAITPTPE